MAVGDRIISPNPPIGGPYSVYEVTDETVVNGCKQAALLTKLVDDAGATLNPAAPVLGAGTNNIGDVDVLTFPQSSTSNTPSIATATGNVLAANASRKSWAIQNVGTNPLFVRLGASASSSVFHFVLKGGTVDSDGLGALLSDNTYTGIVSIAGTSPKYTVTEM